MTLNQTYASLPWEKAMAQILTDSENELAPVLVVRGDDPEKVQDLGKYLGSRPDTLYIRLGHANSMPYIAIELLSRIDPKFSVRYRKNAIPHEKLIIRLCQIVKQLPFVPIIILDRCYHLRLQHLFRIIRFINELEGKAQFVFLLPEDYAPRWLDRPNVNKHLNYFLKVVSKQYQMHE